jgi:hypothetical protein
LDGSGGNNGDGADDLSEQLALDEGLHFVSGPTGIPQILRQKNTRARAWETGQPGLKGRRGHGLDLDVVSRAHPMKEREIRLTLVGGAGRGYQHTLRRRIE